jgi:hypothetical protein
MSSLADLHNVIFSQTRCLNALRCSARDLWLNMHVYLCAHNVIALSLYVGMS